jgi:hypothetical protein
MAIYHLSAQVITRGSGHSAVHAAAYRARCELEDERTGLVHDYSRKAGELLFHGIYAPKDAPAWAHDRAQLWNHVEAFERHRRAELAREFNIALPHELTLEQNRYALQDWIRDNFTRKGLIADAVIHAPGRDGDERNLHAHVMVVMRRLDGSEFVRSKERFETYSEKEAAKKAELETLRESWERIGNRHLERHGHAPTLDRRSLLDQGVERDPTVHLGKDATAIERKGRMSELGELNREIKSENERRVIDLAAERAMREARDAARGRVDDVRPPDSSRDRSRDFSFRKTAREAVQAREPAAAPTPPRQATADATEARSAAATAYRETGKVERATEKAAGKGAGILARGILGALGGFFSALGDMLFPPPPPTPEQQERNHRAAEEKQAARENEAVKDERLQDILRQMARDDQERARQRRERGRDDDDYGRGRERER